MVADAGAPSVDYRSGCAWERLTDLFTRVEPRPDARCGRVRCEPAWHWRTDLTDFDLWLAVSGQGQIRLRHEAHAIRPGTLLCLRPGDDGVVTHRPDDPLTVVYVHFDFFHAGSPRVASVAADLLPSALGAVEARLLLHQAILEAYRYDAANQGVPGVQPEPRVATVLAHLHANPGLRVSLSEAAAIARLSPDRFSRLFHAELGQPFRRYALDVRLDRARHLLDETTMGVADIAGALGYPDAFLFSRQFKARFGVAPSHRRRPPNDVAGRR